MGTVSKGRLGKSVQIPSLEDLKTRKEEREYLEK